MIVRDGSALWVWVGVGFYGELLSAIQLGGEARFLNSPVLRRKLKGLGFSPGEESRDPFSNQVSFGTQHSLSLQQVIPIKTCITMFKQMASDARDLILIIEDTES
jgi:hypothetical protein